LSVAVQTTAVAPAARGPELTSTYAWYVACLLSIAQIVSQMDRYVLSVVIESIKQDLFLSDTQLGILQGPSFVVLFTLASLPLGRLADSVSRRTLISLALFFWSGATAVCAFAHTFLELMLARLAVGLGEAALLPAAMSLIAAYFAPDKFSRGMSIYTLGGSLGRFVGFVGGGAVAAWFAARGGLDLLKGWHISAWHAVFLVAGGIGMVASALVAVTLREPVRRAIVASPWDVRSGLGHFWLRRRAYLAVFVPFSMVNAMVQQLAAWTVSFYVRQHGMAVAAASALVGTTSLLCGPVGHLSGGWLNDRLRARGVQAAQPVVLAGILLLAPVFIVGFAFSPSVTVAACSYGAAYFLISAAGPTGYGGSQLPTPEQHRGVISAVFLMFFTLFGAGLGPLAAGLVGDFVLRSEHQLGLAMVLSTVLFALIGLGYAVHGRLAFARSVAAMNGQA
jgi:MFS family permease